MSAKKRSPRTAAEVITAIPTPPKFLPLPHASNPRSANVMLPPDINSGDPYTLFTLFLTEKHFETIATNTNTYAALSGAGQPGKRAWRETTAAEIKVFIGILIYMGVHQSPQVEDYWNRDLGIGAVHTCSQHMSLNRF